MLNLKYSVDIDDVKKSISEYAKLKVLSSSEIEREADLMRSSYQTDIFRRIIKNIKAKGDYLIFIFLK